MVLFMVGFVLTNGSPDSFSKGAAPKFAHFHASSSRQGRMALSAALIILSGFFFAWFRYRLRAYMRVGEGGEGGLSTLAVTGGVVFVSVLFASVVASHAVGLALTATSHSYKLDANTAVLMDQIGGWLIWGTMIGAAVMLWATSLAGRRTRGWPAWLPWAGFVSSVVFLLFPITFFASIPLFALWILILSVMMLRA